MSEEEEFEFRHRLEQEQAASQSKAVETRPPTDVEAGLNSAAKGLMNLLNTPITLKNLAMMGLAKIPGVGDIPAVQDIASHPTPNYPMQFAEQVGFVDPKLEPQTGMQRMVDATVQGAVGGGPLGAVSGAVGQGVTEATGNEKLGLAAGIATALTPAGIRAAQNLASKATKMNAVKEATLKEVQDAGYKLPPSLVNPTFTTNRVESFAGKHAVQQDFTLRNQDQTNKLAARALGLADDTPLDSVALQHVKEEATKPYRDIANLSPKAAHALDELQQVRFEAKEQWKYYNRSGNPEAGKQARKLDADAAKWEQVIDDEANKIVEQYAVRQERAAKSAAQLETRAIATGKEPRPAIELEKVGETTAGNPKILEELREGRKRLAKLHVVEKALNDADGNVDARVFGRMLDHGAPLTDELRTIGKFAQAFGKVAGAASKTNPPGISGFDAVTMGALAAGGYASQGNEGLALGAIPLLRGPARSYLASKSVQGRLLPQVNATLPTIDYGQELAKAGLASRSLLDAMNQQGGE